MMARFELANDGFADRCLTTWLRHHMKLGSIGAHCAPLQGAFRQGGWGTAEAVASAVRRAECTLERVTRLELATSTLARWRSTG